MKTLKGYAVLLAALAVPGLALAASESESNNPIGLANTLTISADGSASVDAVMGVTSGTAVVDLDFYTFNGKGGDVVTLDIDGGMKAAGTGRSVDTILAVFNAASPYQVLRANDMGGIDPGSVHSEDAKIVNFVLPTTGTYIVGVSSDRRPFLPTGGGTTNATMRTNSNGAYTLIITGVSASLLQISLDIKPDNDELAPINPKSKGKIPVALLGASDFTVQDVNVNSLTFGHSGNEPSLAKCGEPTDVNGDVWSDMLCHFENQEAKFETADLEAILRGELNDGSKFEGRGFLKTVGKAE